jgi:hypothetical protein
MAQTFDIRRLRGRACTRGRTYAARLGGAAAAAFAGLVATALGASAIHFYPDGLPASTGTHFLVDFNPSAAIPRAETPNSLSLSVPSGFKLDTRAVSRQCSPAQAAAIQCPSQSRIGFGHVRVHVSGYLLPGGGTDGVAYLTGYLGPPLARGDPASMVMKVEWLGVDPAFKVLNQYLHTKISPRTTRVGRILYLHTAPYGLRVRFDALPGGLQIPPPVASAGIAAAMTRFKLEVGAIRRVRKNIVRRFKIPTATGGTKVMLVHDHVLIARHLFARPLACPSSGQWPWQIQVGFPDGVQTVAGRVRCHP